MEKNFFFLIFMYVIFYSNKKTFTIKTKKYINYEKNKIIKNKIEVFTVNKKTKKILLQMLKDLHNIFMLNKVIYYFNDIIIDENKINKFNVYKESINLYFIEETFNFKNIKKILEKYNYKIKKYLGFYKIVSNQIYFLDRYFVCINLYPMVLEKNKILLSSNIKNFYLKFFQMNKIHDFDDVFPIRKTRLNNILICVPNHQENIQDSNENQSLVNNTYTPISYIYTKIAGIRNVIINE